MKLMVTESKAFVPADIPAGHILFVCTGNTCRSPMAEALTNHYLRKAGLERFWFATSAGIAVWHRLPAAEGAVEALKEYGLDISGHRSRGIDEISVQDVALILGMTKEHVDFLHDRYPEKKDVTFRFSDYVASGIKGSGDGLPPFAGDVPDPFGFDPAVYLDVARTLAMYAKELVKRLGAPL